MFSPSRFWQLLLCLYPVVLQAMFEPVLVLDLRSQQNISETRVYDKISDLCRVHESNAF